MQLKKNGAVTTFYRKNVPDDFRDGSGELFRRRGDVFLLFEYVSAKKIDRYGVLEDVVGKRKSGSYWWWRWEQLYFQNPIQTEKVRRKKSEVFCRMKNIDV